MDRVVDKSALLAPRSGGAPGALPVHRVGGPNFLTYHLGALTAPRCSPSSYFSGFARHAAWAPSGVACSHGPGGSAPRPWWSPPSAPEIASTSRSARWRRPTPLPRPPGAGRAQRRQARRDQRDAETDLQHHAPASAVAVHGTGRQPAPAPPCLHQHRHHQRGHHVSQQAVRQVQIHRRLLPNGSAAPLQSGKPTQASSRRLPAQTRPPPPGRTAPASSLRERHQWPAPPARPRWAPRARGRQRHQRRPDQQRQDHQREHQMDEPRPSPGSSSRTTTAPSPIWTASSTGASVAAISKPRSRRRNSQAPSVVARISGDTSAPAARRVLNDRRDFQRRHQLPVAGGPVGQPSPEPVTRTTPPTTISRYVPITVTTVSAGIVPTHPVPSCLSAPLVRPPRAKLIANPNRSLPICQPGPSPRDLPGSRFCLPRPDVFPSRTSLRAPLAVLRPGTLLGRIELSRPIAQQRFVPASARRGPIYRQSSRGSRINSARSGWRGPTAPGRQHRPE